jgi:hypothetical protein
MDSDHRDDRDRLAFLRDRFAELREQHAFIVSEYKAGRLSLREEVALLNDLMTEISGVVSEVVLLTRFPASS